MGNFPFGATPALALQAATPAAGFALQNATPTVLSWTAPADGLLHRVAVFAALDVTVATTGGALFVGYHDPAGTFTEHQLYAAAQAVGSPAPASYNIMVQAGQSVQILQTSAMTAGAAALWAEIWGS